MHKDGISEKRFAVFFVVALSENNPPLEVVESKALAS
jgi:hypothetical protein